MLAAEQNQAEQELSKSIRQPRDVRLASSCFNRELSSCGGHLRSFLKPASGMTAPAKMKRASAPNDVAGLFCIMGMLGRSPPGDTAVVA